MITFSWQTISSFLPLWIVALGALALLASSAFLKGERESAFYRFLSTAVLFVAMITLFRNWQASALTVASDILIVGRFNLFLCLLVLLSSFLTILFAPYFTVSFASLRRPEFYSLILLATLGMLMMNLSLNLLFIFLGLELASMSFYTLIAMRQDNRLANEAAIKYFLLGSLGSAIFLYGIAFFYGATQALDLQALRGITLGESQLGYLKLAFLLLFSGLCFKLALFPFYFWSPDVYEGAPTLVTGWMATTVKSAVFGVLLTLLVLFGGIADSAWFQNESILTLLCACAALTMLVGNLLAIRQTQIKRLLAYSSIAHAGYSMIALATCMSHTEGAHDAVSALLFYLLVYTVMTLGAFFVIGLLSTDEDNIQLSQLNGLSRTHPQLAFYLAVFMFSLAGIPPTAGFLGKYAIFIHATRQGLYGLVAIGILSSLIGLYYYLKVIAALYFNEPTPGTVPSRAVVEARPRYYFGIFIIIFLAVATLTLGLFPQEYLLWTWLSR